MPPYRHWPGTTRHNSAVIANSFMPSRDCSAEKGLLSVAADRSRVLTGWWHLQPEKNRFLSGPASGPYHWLLPSACRLGKHFFRAHKNLCFVVDFFLLFSQLSLLMKRSFLASQFRCQCRSIMKQNSVDALWTFPPARTEFVNLIRRPPCLDIGCLFLCVYGFFFRSISCNSNLYCNHTRPIFKKYPVELYAYTTMHTQT